MKKVSTQQNEATLEEDGYFIVQDWLNDSVRLPDFSSKKFKCIFNNDVNRKDDRKRKQVPVRLPQLFKIFKEEYPELTPKSATLLLSESGCQKQAAHCDYVPTTLASPLPLLVFIALEDDTYIDVWPKSHTLEKKLRPIERQQLSLGKGDLLVFRADLVHAGSAYTKRNMRIHLYLDSPAVKRVRNRTYIIHEEAPQEIIDCII
jgi:hypothetical protein